MFLGLARATQTAFPVVVSIFMFVSIYALGSKDIFGSTVVDPLSQTAYFDTFPSSLSTMFQMFSGEWHDIMFQARNDTTEGAQLWFTAYVFLMSVFCAELLVGVVMAQYMELETVKSPRLYPLFSPTFLLGSSERVKVQSTMLELNSVMGVYNQVLAGLTGRRSHSQQMGWQLNQGNLLAMVANSPDDYNQEEPQYSPVDPSVIEDLDNLDSIYNGDDEGCADWAKDVPALEEADEAFNPGVAMAVFNTRG
jgi:hypothetical protein